VNFDPPLWNKMSIFHNNKSSFAREEKTLLHNKRPKEKIYMCKKQSIGRTFSMYCGGHVIKWNLSKVFFFGLWPLVVGSLKRHVCGLLQKSRAFNCHIKLSKLVSSNGMYI
jgi:hypothetical protein